MATKKPAKSKSLYKEDENLGDKDGIVLAYDKETFSYLVSFSNTEIGNNLFIKHELKKTLQDKLKWTPEVLPDKQGAFVVPMEDYEALRASIQNARKVSQEIGAAKEDMKHIVGINLGLTTDKLDFRNAFSKPDTRHNGEILGVNRYFVFQKAGVGKQGTEHEGKQFVHIHKTEKFMHGPQDWANVEETLGFRFKQNDMVSIYYGDNNKAIVQDYIPTQSREQAPQQKQQFSQAM